MMRSWLSPARIFWLLVSGLWLWELGGLGLASETEVPILKRAFRWLGAEPQALPRAPEFADIVRALALSLDPQPFARSELGHALAKAPNLLAALALLGIAWDWGQARKMSALGCMAVVAALPITNIAARHLTPDLWGELALSTFLWSRHCRPLGPKRRRLIELLSLCLLVHCAGLWWGLSVAAGLVWLEDGHRGWGALALVSALASLALCISLGDAYQPWLSAARDPLTLHEGLPRPFTSALMSIISDFGLWAPWVGFAWLSAGHTLNLERRWLALVWTSQVLSCVAFAPGPIIGILPASVLIVSAAARERDGRSFCELALTSLLGGALLLRTLPHFADRLAWPHTRALELGSEIASIEQVWLIQAALGAAMLTALRFARHPKPWLLGGLLLSVAINAQLKSSRLAQLSSVKSLAAPLYQLDESGVKIASYGVEDPGWGLYAPAHWPRLETTRDAEEHLLQPEASVLVLEAQSEKQMAGQLSHIDAPLVQLSIAAPQHLALMHDPPQASATRPFRTFARLTQVPEMTHPTRVIFDDALELLGWEFSAPLKRGGTSEFQAVFRVLAPVKGPHRLVPQIRGLPFSPWPGFESPSSSDRFPISSWQPGDLILFRKPMKVPWLLTSSGALELSLGLARSRYHYKPITFPTQDSLDPSSMRWLGKKHRRIVLGKVTVDDET